MPKFKVTQASPRNIVMKEVGGTREITVGNTKHKAFFKIEGGFKVPAHAQGAEIEIPEGAIDKSDQTGRHFVIGEDLSIEDLQRVELKRSIALKERELKG